jgi:catechol 2,3-dioxygenase-like lactoylglutathione lyase family enzyme
MSDIGTASASILSHVPIGTRDFDRATRFHDTVVATLGCHRIIEHPGAVAYGRAYPEFWVQLPIDGKPASVGNGTHFGFFAGSKTEDDAFHAAGLAAGATDDGKRGPRSAYGAPYDGCVLRDPDGHKIEAAFWDLD